MPFIRTVSLRLTLIAVLVGTWSLGAAPTALAWGQPGLVPGVPSDVRSPKIAGESNRVHMITFQAESAQLLYSHGTTNAAGEVSWERPRRIAEDVKLAWNIVADATGTVHVAYATNDRRIYYIKNSRGGDFGNWTTPELVATLDLQANELDIALDAANNPYLAWGQDVNPSVLRMAYRAANGAWVANEVAGRAYLYRYATLVVTGAGDGATVHIMTERKEGTGSQLEILYGAGPRDGPFSVQAFSGSFGIGALSAQPTMALDRGTGTIYTGFFSGNDLDFEFLFSYSRDNGATWSPVTTTRLGDDLVVTEKSPMVAGNNRAYIMLQVKRVGNGGFISSGFYDTEFNPADGSFTPPDPLRDVRGTDYKNVAPDYTINAQAKVGVWVPGFTAGGAYNSEPGSIPGVAPVPVGADAISINAGAPATRSSTVAVTVVNPVGSPTRMRVAVDAPLTDATPSEPFQPTFTRTLPAGCQHTVTVELQNDLGGAPAVFADAIVLDSELSARVLASNPGAGLPTYTREPRFRLQAIGVNECSGLKSVRGGASAQSLGAPAAITDNLYDAVLPLPAPAQPGLVTVVTQVDDVAGNTGLFTTTLVYDPAPPTLVTTGKLTVTTPISGANVLAQLRFAGSRVTDVQYGGRGFWGVQLLNSRAPISDTQRASLPWVTVEAPGDASDFTLPAWGLLAGLAPAERTSGAYYVYARFVDGAGNPTTGVVSGTVTLGAIRPVEVRLPVVSK